MLVDLVGDDEDSLLHADVRDLLHLSPVVRRAGRIEGVHNDRFRLRRDSLLKERGGQEKPFLFARGENHGRCAGELDLVRVRDPVRRGDDDLVSFLEQGEGQVEEDVLPPFETTT